MESNTHFVDKIAEAMRRAATELEELQLQAALGKAEARDKYEELKKKFNGYVHEAKEKFEAGKDKVDDLRNQFEALKLQLSLGKADTIDAFKEQKEKILNAIGELERKIKGNETLNRIYAVLLIEIEKLKIQLEWLEEKYKEGKASATESYEKGKATFLEYVESFKARFGGEEKSKWENFQDEMAEAFTHLKKAFVQN